MLAIARLERISPYFFLIKGLVLLLTLYFLFQTLQHGSEEAGNWPVLLLRSIIGPMGFVVLLAAGLIPVNWGLEAAKWRLLAQKLEPVSYTAALRAVMVGLTLGFVTPNRLGDYAGRILEMGQHRRSEAIGAVFLGRVSQLWITLTLGGSSLLYLSFQEGAGQKVLFGIGVGVLFFAGLMLTGFLSASAVLRNFKHVGFLKVLLPYVQIIGTYSRLEVTRVLGFAFLRYAVFSLQFALLLVVFGLELEMGPTAAAISGTYLLKSLLPSFSALGDLGLREVSAIWFFGYFGAPHLPVLAASLSLWLLNIGLPSLLGLLFVFRLRFSA